MDVSDIIPINEKLHALENETWRKKEQAVFSADYVAYRTKWVQYPKCDIVNIPLNIDIELTNACNLRCVMCPRTIFSSTRSKIGFMDRVLYQHIIDDAAALSIPAVKVLWRGESTLHPDLCSCVRYAKQAGIIDVALNTNATLITKELATELIESGLDKIIFSFDSPYKETYEHIRVGASYDTVLYNIRQFCALRNTMGAEKPLTRVSMVNFDASERELHDFIDLFQGVVDCITFTDGFRPGKAASLDKFQYQQFRCPQPWQRLVISWDGMCYACCRDEQGQYPVGDIRKDSIMSIWHGEPIENLREAHRKHAWQTFPVCVECQQSIRAARHRIDGMI